MKKIISIAVVLCLVLVLAACGKGSTSSPETNSGESTESFVKPEQYASVLLVTINPQFKLYLDESGKVLAVEAVNKDAESIKNSISFKNKSFETVIETIVNSAHKNGFVKENAKISFAIVESKETDNVKADILSKAEKKATDTANDLKINVKVNENTPTGDTTASEAKPSDVPTSSVAKPNNIPTSSATKPVNSRPTSSVAKPNASKPAHMHSFSAATCTAPKKCSCGAVEGAALGHSYKNGVCTRCKAKDPNNTFTSALKKKGKWTAKYLNQQELYAVNIFICDPGEYSVGASIGDPLSNLPSDMQNDPNIKNYCIAFNGKDYYVGRGTGGDIKSATEKDNTLTLIDDLGNKLVFTRISENVLKCNSAANTFADIPKIPVGLEFTFVAN